MELLLLIIFAIIISIGSYCLIKRRSLYGKTIAGCMGALIPVGWKETVCLILAPLSCVSVALMLYQFYGSACIFTIKRLIVIGLLWPIAAADYREYRIPNKMILLGLGLRVLLIIPELLVDGKEALPVLLTEGIAAIGAILICLVCMLVSRGSLGMGDLKLMVLMALYLGIEGICYAMFISVFVTFFVSVSLLFLKKKRRTDVIPFAPFILLGTFISFILTGT